MFVIASEDGVFAISTFASYGGFKYRRIFIRVEFVSLVNYFYGFCVLFAAAIQRTGFGDGRYQRIAG